MQQPLREATIEYRKQKTPGIPIMRKSMRAKEAQNSFLLFYSPKHLFAGKSPQEGEHSKTLRKANY